MQGESIQFYIFLVILFIGGILVIVLIRALSEPRRRPPQKQKEVPLPSAWPPLEKLETVQPATDIASVLNEVMEKIPTPTPIELPMPETASIIETKDLRKTFVSKVRGKTTTVEAVRGISFSVARGEIFGLLGPNGAGKTTTMRMLATLITPSSGTAKIVGYDLATQPEKIRMKIGYVSQVGGMQREVSGRENLMLQARLYGMNEAQAQARVNEILKALAIESFADRRTVTYSGGQRRIFDLASGIIHQPDLLFLDEPSTGLDPQNRAHVWEQVKKLSQKGTTIFVTTHYLEEADALCDRVAIVDKGTIVALDTPDALKRQIAGDIISLSVAEHAIEQAQAALVNQPYLKEIQVRDGALQLYVEKGDENLPMVMKVLNDQSIAITAISLSRPSLDDVFLKFTGRSLGEA